MLVISFSLSPFLLISRETMRVDNFVCSLAPFKANISNIIWDKKTLMLSCQDNLLEGSTVFNLQDTRYCPCQEFTKGASIRYRTHLFLLEFEYNVFSPIDVTLAIQCSADRATLLEDISKHWTGSISVALYLTDTEVQTFLEFVRCSENLRKRKNIAYHVVYKDGVRWTMFLSFGITINLHQIISEILK